VALAIALPFTPLVPDGDHPARSASQKAVSIIGEPRTADPCALTDATALGRFGRTELDIDYGNFDRCDVIVYSGEDSVVDVQVDLNSGPGPELTAVTKNVGRIRVVEDRPEDEACNRTLLLPAPDNTTNITVTAKQTEKGPAPLCAIADAATTTATTVLNKGPIARRSPPLPANSLAQQDACALLNAKALNIVPGIDASDPDVGFGRWNCEWHSTTGRWGRYVPGPRRLPHLPRPERRQGDRDALPHRAGRPLHQPAVLDGDQARRLGRRGGPARRVTASRV
jgi:hypothetical protein